MKQHYILILLTLLTGKLSQKGYVASKGHSCLPILPRRLVTQRPAFLPCLASVSLSFHFFTYKMGGVTPLWTALQVVVITKRKKRLEKTL